MTVCQYSLMLEARDASRFVGAVLSGSCCAQQQASGVLAGTPPRW